MAGTAVSIPQLGFAVEDAQRLAHAAIPTLRFALRIDAEGRDIRSVLLDVQIQIAARRRAYAPATHARLFEVFGPVAGWGAALRTLLWTRQTLVVPPFTAATTAQLAVPCSYDLEVLASRYLDALDGGEVPLELLFSGTLLYAGEDGRLQAGRISWEREAEVRLPVAVWRETMEHHFRGTSWLRMRKDVVDRLAAYRSRHALTSWEETMERLLDG
jgi:Family of unknown function (DUF6084)